MKIKIYFEKPENSNPYYANNENLYKLSRFIDYISNGLDSSNHISVTNIIGGQRNSSSHDCELTLMIKSQLLGESNERVNDIISVIKEYGGFYEIVKEASC